MIYTDVTNLVIKPLSSEIVVQAFSWFLNSALQRSIAILLAMLDKCTTLQISQTPLVCKVKQRLITNRMALKKRGTSNKSHESYNCTNK